MKERKRLERKKFEWEKESAVDRSIRKRKYRGF